MNDIRFVNILEVDDILKERVRCWRNKEEVRKGMFTQHIISREEHANWLEDLKNRNDRKFWIVFFENVPIGSVNLQNIHDAKLTSEWGFYIGEDEYRGKGLGKCILFKLLEMFFEEMKFKMLITKTLFNNNVALELYKKFRFKETGKIPFKPEVPIVVLEFSNEDWLKFREELTSECRYKNRG